jgi:transposase
MGRFKEKPLDPSQYILFSQSVDDALPQDSDVRSFSDVMDCLDYTAMEAKCSAVGCPPYPPKEMVKVLCYAYSIGIRSSRCIEKLLKFDLRFIWLSCGLKPDHNTIARFRKDNSPELTSLFQDSVRLCMRAGLVFLNAVATDGSKIVAAASTESVYGKARLERAFKAVEKILAEAEATDAAEDKESDSQPSVAIPEHLRDAKERKAKLQEIAKHLEESKKVAVVTSDTQARVMLSHKQTRPCYNFQASVDTEKQVIVAMELTQDEVDSRKLPEMIEQIEQNTGLSPGISLADCGYSDERTIQWLNNTNHQALMPIRESQRNWHRNDLFASKCFFPEDDRDVLICPAGRELTFKVTFCGGGATYRKYAANDCQSCSFYRECVPKGRGSRRVNVPSSIVLRKAMKEKLSSEEGKKLFSLRCQTVEPVFGQIKSNMRFDRFIAWGLKGACAEAALVSIAHNVKKCVAQALEAAIFLSVRVFRAFSWVLAICDCPLSSMANHSVAAPVGSF